jgi:hypothetical protein
MPWKPVVVASFNHPVQAELACSRLRAEGIRACVADAHTISIQPFYSNVLGGVKVLVDELDAHHAISILKEDHSPELEDEGFDGSDGEE